MEMFLVQSQQQMKEEHRWHVEEAHHMEEDRRAMQVFLQMAITAFLAVNNKRKDDRNYDGDRDNNDTSSST
jgi:hypothetical protein